MKNKIILVFAILSFSNVFAQAINVKQDTLKEDKEFLMDILEEGECGQVCLRYENNSSYTIKGDTRFGFCRVSVTICKDM